MISGTNSSVIRNAYASSSNEVKEQIQTKETKTTTVTQQGDKSRVEELKDAINSGTYKVDLNKLSEMIADELM
jgi:anti-sigma28 factor (negative regulator of flagellin synthesis)